jgi:hypothetical protein
MHHILSIQVQNLNTPPACLFFYMYLCIVMICKRVFRYTFTVPWRDQKEKLGKDEQYCWNSLSYNDALVKQFLPNTWSLFFFSCLLLQNDLHWNIGTCTNPIVQMGSCPWGVSQSRHAKRTSTRGFVACWSLVCHFHVMWYRYPDMLYIGIVRPLRTASKFDTKCDCPWELITPAWSPYDDEVMYAPKPISQGVQTSTTTHQVCFYMVGGCVLIFVCYLF